jgi:hypothetical protein
VSRAFIKEMDDRPEELLERRVSSHTNLVTQEGLAAIEKHLAAAATAEGLHSQPAMMRRSRGPAAMCAIGNRDGIREPAARSK